jgi:hypothetical protein
LKIGATYNQPLAKGNKSSGSESRTITLRTTPRAGECGLIHVELGFTQATTGEGARGIGDRLEIGLGANVFLNDIEQVSITVLEQIDQDL